MGAFTDEGERKMKSERGEVVIFVLVGAALIAALAGWATGQHAMRECMGTQPHRTKAMLERSLAACQSPKPSQPDPLDARRGW